MSRYRHTHDPDVDNAEYGEMIDAAYDATPTRAEANADDALDARYPTPYTPGPLTDALEVALRLNRYAQCREAAEAARRDGDHAGARYWDAEAERWAG